MKTVIAVVSCLIAVSLVTLAEYNRQTYARHTSVESRPLNSATTKAIDLQLDQSRTLYEVAVVFLAALWGLVAGKNTSPISLRKWQHWLMLVSATFLLLASLFWRVLYLNGVTSAYTVGGSTGTGGEPTSIPDIFDDKYQHRFTFQWYLLAAGAAIAIVTVIDARGYHEDEDA